MKRAILLALLFAVAVGIAVPLINSEAARNKDRQAAASRKKIKKYSRAWWRRYHARVRKKRGLRAKTANAWRKQVVPESRQVSGNHTPARENVPSLPESRGGEYADTDAALTVNLPEGWSSRPVLVNGERKFMVFGPNGQPVGQATLSSAWARDAQDEGGVGRNRSLGGIPLRELRRTIIDKMAQANGWVVSDSEEEINGRRVFVVNAQTGSSDGKPQQSWNYYFTQAEGRVYNLTTNAPVEYSEQMSGDSSRVLGSLKANGPRPMNR